MLRSLIAGVLSTLLAFGGTLCCCTFDGLFGCCSDGGHCCEAELPETGIEMGGERPVGARRAGECGHRSLDAAKNCGTAGLGNFPERNGCSCGDVGSAPRLPPEAAAPNLGAANPCGSPLDSGDLPPRALLDVVPSGFRDLSASIGERGPPGSQRLHQLCVLRC